MKGMGGYGCSPLNPLDAHCLDQHIKIKAISYFSADPQAALLAIFGSQQQTMDERMMRRPAAAR